jgi:hypothetical protein
MSYPKARILFPDGLITYATRAPFTAQYTEHVLEHLCGYAIG